jgi:DNA-binding CsgD family transcriptional regulator
MATSQRPASPQRGFQCPICGAWENEGSCREIRNCISALIAAETESTGETVAMLAREQSAQQVRVLRAGLHALSKLQIGLLVCDAAGQVIAMNRVAESILEKRDGLELGADGLLCATQESKPAIAARVKECADAVRSARSPHSPSAVAIDRGPGRRRLSVFLRPSNHDLRKSPAGKGTVLVIVLDSELPVGAVVPELQQVYGFTTSEARLANLLMEGKGLEDCCAELGIRRATACTHLRRLFAKTGVHRQSELVSLLLRSIGLAHLARPAKIGSADGGKAGLS